MPPWFTRDSQPTPVPLTPMHRRVWRRLRRYCSCGLRWTTCPDRRIAGRNRRPDQRDAGRTGRRNGGHW